ncbi:MAG TPA: hypothetical protein VFK58_04625 [Sphingomicrobium sp.]|nr:hypothetical protein [Sphingomicrobium sp.]
MSVREPPEVTAARIEAGRRRARLMETAHRLQARLSPAVLARGAWQGAKEKGADLAENAVDAVRKRPVAATGVVAAIALFLAREPLKDLAGKLVDGVGGKAPDKKKTTRSKTETVE